MLRIDQLSVAMGGVPLIDRLDLRVPTGGRLAVLGRSGAGKTSLLRVIAGHVPAAAGTVEHRPASGPPRVLFVPQEPVLFAALTVAENLAVFRRSAGTPASTSADQIADLLAAFGLSELRNKLCAEISGGEQQRVALARAVAVSPTLLLVDEPTARQDAGHREAVTAALVRSTSDGVLVVATHDVEVASSCDQVITLDEPG